MTAAAREIAALQTIIALSTPPALADVILFHGYQMQPDDLAPFAKSMNIAADFYFPRGIHTEATGYSWWPVDQAARATALQSGPRDLVEEHPPMLSMARQRAYEFFAAIRQANAGRPMVIGGFSQGGMLACDAALHGAGDIAGLILLSASRLAFSEWAPLLHRLKDLPVFVSHGNRDPDLAFGSGERLRDALVAAGANVTWVPFDGEHQIPLVVWRQLRKFLTALTRPAGRTSPFMADEVAHPITVPQPGPDRIL
jgi:phospholipase/carboxylesterase